MAFTGKNLLALAAAVASFVSLASASGVAKPELIRKRSALHERQACRTSGWIPACPGPFACVPPGAICCSDGISYAMPPEVCPDGTQPIATAITNAPPPVITTPPPSSPTVEYTWYTYTITWYYWYYYYIYVDITSTRLVSTEYTTVSTISYSATDEAAASSYFKDFTATAVLPTPTQTNTPVPGTPPASSIPSYPTETPSETSTYEPEPESFSSAVVVPSYSTPPGNSSVTSSAPTLATSSPVTAGAGRAGTIGSSWASMAGAVVGFLSGVLMIVL